MFSRDKAEPRANAEVLAPVRKAGTVPSIISNDLRVIGNLASEGDLQIDGTIEGDVVSKSLTVGINAKVMGSISADEARICGTVEGEVRASVVTVAESARVIGDILHDKLAVETGAYLEGNCRRLPAKEPVKQPETPTLSARKDDDDAAIKAVDLNPKVGVKGALGPVAG